MPRTGTSLESSLDLPSMSPTLDPCDVALTSFRKVTSGRICLQHQQRCNLPCAVAWGSLLRDFEQTTNSTCLTLKTAIKAWQPSIIDTGFGLGTSSPVSLEEGGRLAQTCAGALYNCPDNHCERTTATIGLDGTSSRCACSHACQRILLRVLSYVVYRVECNTPYMFESAFTDCVYAYMYAYMRICVYAYMRICVCITCLRVRLQIV